MLEMLAVTLLLEIVREAVCVRLNHQPHGQYCGRTHYWRDSRQCRHRQCAGVTMAAAATIATLAVPSLYEQSILFRFCVILLAGLFGVLGLTCAALMILAMACGSEPFGYDYLYR